MEEIFYLEDEEDILRKYYKTADEEEPDCLECDCYSDGYLCDKCGPEYGWYWYRRTLSPEEREDNESD